MREIKFRVRNKNNGQYEYYTLSDIALICGLPAHEDWENVEQFTGLCDGDREVYEGDVYFHQNEKFVVQYINNGFVFTPFKNFTVGDYILHGFLEIDEEWEYIGTIHDEVA